jgi:FixJ family two-component response regulator
MSVNKAVVYIVEDDLSFRKSVERLVRASGFEAVVFESADAFLAQSCIRRPSCLLLDVQLPGINGLELQQKLIEKGSGLPIIFMTGHGDIPMSVKAMKKGAVDFLPKPFESKDLRSSIQKALESDSQNRKIENQTDKIKSLVDTLTPREQEVLSWVITGKPNKQIASALGTTVKTIKVHRSRVMHKTGVTSLVELVHLAQKANISPAA